MTRVLTSLRRFRQSHMAFTPTPNPSPQGGGGSGPFVPVKELKAPTSMKASPPPCGEGQGGGSRAEAFQIVLPRRWSACRLRLLAGVAALALSLAALHPTAACENDCGSGFSISVDGERLAGDAPGSTATPAADIQVKYDGLEVKPTLNVSTVDLRRTYQAGEAVEFFASMNYAAWVVKKEVLVYETGRHASSRPIAVLPVDETGHAAWTMPEDGEGEFTYVLRVVDGENRFDETVPLSISRSTAVLPRHTKEAVPYPGYGEDRTALRNIPVYGGAVTVYGTGVPTGDSVQALGEAIPVDKNGSFVAQRILPPGDHQVDVAVAGEGSKGLAFSRAINIPENDWFYVGLADFTLGRHLGDGAVEAAGDDYDKTWTKGRLAFYLKGKIKGRTLLTAAADTGEGKIGDMFKGFDSKDARGVLKRIDPDSYYPVYGDDSTSVDGAPTDGKFYVRLDRGDSHVMWGRYKAEINDAKLLRNERTLYGAEGVYRSDAATSFGERKVEAKVYAAQPGTLPHRDVLRGTGGSAYFLTRQDVTKGTETVTVLVSDPLSGRVVSRRQLVPGEDYDINYLQGVVILQKPLHSTARDIGIVRDAALGEYNVDLVANYEYTPATGEVDDYALGGQASAWLGDHVQVGATGMKEETGLADQKMGGASIKIRKSDGTFIEGEYAETKGPGFGRTLSTDGGLTSVDELTSGTNLSAGEAWRLRGELDLADVNPSLKGRATAWFEQMGAGFSTLDHNIDADQRTAGAAAAINVTESSELRGGLENFEDDAGRSETKAFVEAEQALGKGWFAALGLRYTDRDEPTGEPGRNGQRVDLGTKVTYKPSDDTELYAFGQVTVDRKGGIDRNDRVGVGARQKLTEKIGVEGEISSGTSGIGALAAVTYDPTADDHYYAGYRLDPDAERRTELDGVNLGGVVVGARRRYSDALSAYAENNYDMFGLRRSLTSTYGLSYTPDERWTIDGGVEVGGIVDPNASDFDRKGLSLAAAYKDDDRLSASAKGETRFEESEDGTRDRQSYLLASSLSVKMSEDWRLLSGIDTVFSSSDQTSLLDGDYVDGQLGFAYRPVDNDRLNALGKYQFLYDLPGPHQVTANGSSLGPAQRSHVVSLDVNYDLTKWLSVGGKYGLRVGEVSTTRAADDFVASMAQLAVLRADVNFAKKWDAMVEARALSTTDTVRYGAVTTVYYHTGEHMKVGLGYNFGKFSDDLTDLTYDDQGVLVNAVGKF